MARRLWKQALGSMGLLMAVGMLSLPGVQSLHAQGFPTKPINLIIPFGAGGSSDLTARAIIGTAKEHLGQPVVIHMRPGGGGAIASEEVAQAKPDGYNILFGHTNSNTLLPVMEGRSRPALDYEPVCHISKVYGFFLVAPDAPFKTFQEMITWAKANPGKLTFGNNGPWSLTDFMWKMIEHQFGVKTRTVTYPGGGEALIGLLGGHVQVIHNAPTQSLPQIKAGKVRALGYSGPQRHQDLPDLPTQKEQGFDSTPFCSWKGMLAPKGTPRPVVDKIALGFKKMTEAKEAVAMIRKLGDAFEYMGPDEFKKFLQADFQTYSELSKLFKQ
jgi:tripartite-type tricarboxylate transporter receptor subunit TctC